MANEGPREVRQIGRRERVVAVSPEAAVERVHETRLAGDDADRHPAADDLAVCGHVGLDAEPALSAPGMDAESGDHLVEDTARRGVLQFSKLAEKFFRLGSVCALTGSTRSAASSLPPASESRATRRCRSQNEDLPPGIGERREPRTARSCPHTLARTDLVDDAWVRTGKERDLRSSGHSLATRMARGRLRPVLQTRAPIPGTRRPVGPPGSHSPGPISCPFRPYHDGFLTKFR